MIEMQRVWVDEDLNCEHDWAVIDPKEMITPMGPGLGLACTKCTTQQWFPDDE